jgi:hypothetical protein
MRKIEHDMCAAIRARDVINTGNTLVTQHPETGQAEITLFGNRIALVNYYKGIILLDDCGHKTDTTKSRLNALLDMFTATGGGQGIHQRAGLWYWRESELWPGKVSVRLLI